MFVFCLQTLLCVLSNQLAETSLSIPKAHQVSCFLAFFILQGILAEKNQYLKYFLGRYSNILLYFTLEPE